MNYLVVDIVINLIQRHRAIINNKKHKNNRLII